MSRTLVDTGPLVALIDRGDEHHERCVKALKQIRGELVTVWPVITEASYLLADVPLAHDMLLAKVEAEELTIADLTSADVPSIRALMRKYRDQPMDLADAAVVCAAIRDSITEVFTLDRHFRAYRAAHGRSFTLRP